MRLKSDFLKDILCQSSLAVASIPQSRQMIVPALRLDDSSVGWAGAGAGTMTRPGSELLLSLLGECSHVHDELTFDETHF